MKRCVPFALVLAAVAVAQTPPSADSIMADARAQAQASHRTIFTIYHASW